jgi:hypothetical protein
LDNQQKLGPVVAFVGWIVIAALIVWLFIVARNAILNLFEVFYVGESVWRARQLEAFDKFYALIGSAVGLFFIAAIGAYFQKIGSEPGVYWKVTLVLGIELLVLALFHGILLALQWTSGGGWQRFLFFGVELGVGIVCMIHTIVARRRAQFG